MSSARPVAWICALAVFVALTGAVAAVQAPDARAKPRARACSATTPGHHLSPRRHARRAAARALRRRLAGCFGAHSTGQPNVVADAIPPPPPCSPSLFSAPYTEMNEGTTNSRLPLQPGGRISAVMLFVDFPNLHATEATSRLFDDLMSHSRAWFAEASYGRVALDVTPVQRWYRLPRGSRDYGLGRLTFEAQRSFIADAVAAADADVDFSPYQVVYVVAAKGTPLERSPAFHSYPGDGIRADGVELRYGATFGEDVRGDARYASNVLIHETGHVLGLPDLYDVPNPTFWSLFRFTGSWDTMSWNELGAHFLAWEKWKLGWLDPVQLACLEGPGQLTATISPLERAGGLKALVVPTGVSSAYVVEARRRIGQDARLCESGVLVYSVDATVRSGYGPVRVRAAQRETSGDLVNRCGPLYNAPFDAAKGEVARFSDDAAGISVQVLSSGTDGYGVRVTRTSVAPQGLSVSSPQGGGSEQSFAPPEASFPFGLGWDLSLAGD